MKLKHFLIDFENESVYRYILELMDKGKGNEMRINNPQSTEPNKPFIKNSYLTTLRKVHQAAWNYGGSSLYFYFLKCIGLIYSSIATPGDR